jgi:hypothetical protein
MAIFPRPVHDRFCVLDCLTMLWVARFYASLFLLSG